MTDLTTTFTAIDKELAALLPNGSAPAISKMDMTPAQFVNYCGEQIALAKAGEDAANRIAHLQEIVSLAKQGFEDGATVSVALYAGDLSVQAQSRWAEKMEQSFSVPGPQAAPATGGMEVPSGPTGPLSNTAAPALSAMPPAFPTVPASGAEGFIAKAAAVLAKAENGQALLAELTGMLTAEAQPGDGRASYVEKDDGWPHDLATKTFLDGATPTPAEDDFGGDPAVGLPRGKLVD